MISRRPGLKYTSRASAIRRYRYRALFLNRSDLTHFLTEFLDVPAVDLVMLPAQIPRRFVQSFLLQVLVIVVSEQSRQWSVSFSRGHLLVRIWRKGQSLVLKS